MYSFMSQMGVAYLQIQKDILGLIISQKLIIILGKLLKIHIPN